jgi:hypothetical protein
MSKTRRPPQLSHLDPSTPRPPYPPPPPLPLDLPLCPPSPLSHLSSFIPYLPRRRRHRSLYPSALHPLSPTSPLPYLPILPSLFVYDPTSQTVVANVDITKEAMGPYQRIQDKDSSLAKENYPMDCEMALNESVRREGGVVL